MQRNDVLNKINSLIKFSVNREITRIINSVTIEITNKWLSEKSS